MLSKKPHLLKNTIVTSNLAVYLCRDGWLHKKQVLPLQHAATEAQMSFIQYLVFADIFSSEALLTYCATTFKLPIFQFDQTLLNLSALNGLPENFIHHHRVLPLYRDQFHLYIGMSDPTNKIAIDALQFHLQTRIRIMLIAEHILSHYLSPSSPTHQKTTIIPFEKVKTETLEEIDESVIIFVDDLLNNAIKKKASDIHLEPYNENVRIRFRCDGLLHEINHIEKAFGLRVISRLKILANLNIAERRLPQDGHFILTDLKSLNIRLSTCPTLFGEKIVLRLFFNNEVPLTLSELGMSSLQLEHCLQSLQQPQGLILVTGPTGSGKTFTLYAALAYLNQIEKNICTVEDPVEVELFGINQVNINPRIGLHFATVLRHFLRQDPDVIMIGEIRDTETAEVAFRAAHTGHLVLATLHTNNALDSILRLQSLGIATHDIINTLSLIIAQRLIRKLCDHCKQPTLKNSAFYTASGCQHCHNGYQGRTGVFEVIPITATRFQQLDEHNKEDFIQQLRKENIQFLSDAALEKMQQGITSYAEVTRVIGCD